MTNLPVCSGTIIVVKIKLLNSASVITNFVIPKARQKIHHTFLSTATIPTTLGMVIEEIRTIFASPNFFGSDQ